MTSNEIKSTVYNAIEALQNAKPGRGDLAYRAAQRKLGNDLLASLPAKWYRKLGKDGDAIAASLADVA